MSRKKGEKYEKIVSKFLKREYGMEVKQNINSGAFNIDKGDLTAIKDDETYMVEVKGTSKTNYRLTSKVLNKTIEDAYDKLHTPLFVILCYGTSEIKIAVIADIEIKYNSEVKVNKSYNFKFEELEDMDTLGIDIRDEKALYKLGVDIYEYRR